MIGLLLGFIVNNLEMGAKFNPDRPEQGQLFSEFISYPFLVQYKVADALSAQPPTWELPIEAKLSYP